MHSPCKKAPRLRPAEQTAPQGQWKSGKGTNQGVNPFFPDIEIVEMKQIQLCLSPVLEGTNVGVEELPGL